MQAIYYPYSQLTVGMEDEIKVISRHDEYSLWFDVVKANRSVLEMSFLCIQKTTEFSSPVSMNSPELCVLGRHNDVVLLDGHILILLFFSLLDFQ